MFHIITSVWLIVKSTSASSPHISNLGLFILIGIPQSMIKHLVVILWCEKDNLKWQRNVNSWLIVNIFFYIWRAVTMKHFFLYIIIRNKRIISHKCVGNVLRMEAKQTFGRTCLRLFIVFTCFFLGSPSFSRELEPSWLNVPQKKTMYTQECEFSSGDLIIHCEIGKWNFKKNPLVTFFEHDSYYTCLVDV